MTEQMKLGETFKLIPVVLPRLPEYIGKRAETIDRFMVELGIRSRREAQFFLAEIGWTYYDILDVFTD